MVRLKAVDALLLLQQSKVLVLLHTANVSSCSRNLLRILSLLSHKSCEVALRRLDFLRTNSCFQFSVDPTAWHTKGIRKKD
ncbi:Hypothetical predicted protein [Olea europaea subsp. europaea]|uniref:Uncharacterized protein n=2 Tax=Olea europaea subsp. europaea TaxID=158383 RepID=A0A8S0RTQ1_OLEEU|nr:Hypothetical predicted protein [Olea europaea subsp. europaea]